MNHRIAKYVFIGLTLLGVLYEKSFTQSITLELQNIEQIKNETTGNIEPTVFVGESFNLNVTLQNINQSNPQLSIEGLGSFNNVGIMQASNLAFKNKNQSISHITYKHTLIAPNEGTFTIGPATLNNQNISSNSLKIRVIKRPPGYQSSNRKGSANSDIEFFCELKPAKHKAVVGEPLEVIISMYSRGQILNLSIEVPTFSDFLLKEVMQAKVRQEVRNEKVYDVTEKKIILTPLKTGEKHIDPVLIRYAHRAPRPRARDFFDHAFLETILTPQIQQQTTLSNDLTITVDPLPRHKGIVNGVGEFSKVSAWINKNEAQINEALLYKLTVEGKGNLDQVTAPKLSLPSGFKYYESKNFVEEDFNEDFIPGKKTFEYVIQIPKVGDWKIPAQSFTFYNTASGSYQTLQTEPLLISILPLPQNESDENTPSQNDKKKEQSSKQIQGSATEKTEDINFIQEDTHLEGNQTRALPFWLLLLLLLMITVSLNFSTFSFLRKWYYRIFRVSGKKRLDLFEKQLDELIKRDCAQGLYQLLMAFLATKYDLPESSITHDWVSQRLDEEGIPAEKNQEFMDYLNECASLHFVAQAKSLAEQRNLLKRGKYWIIFLGK